MASMLQPHTEYGVYVWPLLLVPGNKKLEPVFTDKSIHLRCGKVDALILGSGQDEDLSTVLDKRESTRAYKYYAGPVIITQK